MSLTAVIAMARENALLERSTESNQAPRPIGIELSDASAEFESSTRSGGALCWESANGGSETPVVSQTSFGCPGPAIVTTTSKVAKSISQYSVSTSVLAGAQSPDAGSRSEEIQVSFHALIFFIAARITVCRVCAAIAKRQSGGDPPPPLLVRATRAHPSSEQGATRAPVAGAATPRSAV